MKINETITCYEINKIFANKEEKMEYLKKMYENKNIDKNIPNVTRKIEEEIIETWEYEISKKIIREMFRKTDKYKNSKQSDKFLKEMMEEWNKLSLGEYNWPFHPVGFDQYIQRINCQNITEEEKDVIVKKDIVKFRRIKRINTFRNDFIEYLIFENNDNIVPTLKHNKGVDFYINGFPYDQKVSRSVTKEFKNSFGDNWKYKAINNPEIVAEYLYKYQDEQRFGIEPRLLIVYLDENVSNKSIYNCVRKVDFAEPIKINFEYTHSNNINKNYSTECYIILLYN